MASHRFEPMEAELRRLVAAERDRIDHCIRDAAALYYKHHGSKPHFKYDVDRCVDESFNLSQGLDLCYDRPAVGLSYALWYQGRRMNTFLPFFLSALAERMKEGGSDFEIFDLGAGTGAVQMSVALALYVAQKNFGAVPKVRVMNVDSSPFMLAFNRNYLWESFLKQYPESKSLVAPAYQVNSWINAQEVAFTNPWFVASYLFDHKENISSLRAEFVGLVKRYKPERVFLVTSNHVQKRQHLDGVVDEVKALEYASNVYDTSLLFRGSMQEVEHARQKINDLSGTNFRNLPVWHEQSFYAQGLRAAQRSMDMSVEEAKSPHSLDLYNPPIKIRRDILLNDEQKAASRLNGQPTSITGPAGCGKSVVITERVRNLVRASNYATHHRILITTFNKGLVGYLSNWVIDLLDKDRLNLEKSSPNLGATSTDTTGPVYIWFKGSEHANISLMNFDLLPTRVGGIKDKSLSFDKELYPLIETAIAEVKSRAGMTASEDVDILNPHYVLDEYHRVYYGQMRTIKEAYLNGERTRRKPKLHLGNRRRVLMWDTMQTFRSMLVKANKESIFCRRQRFLDQLREGENRGSFTYIFVDEFQDCTLADYSIFFGLLNDNNHLVVAGDFAQAVHTGPSGAMPRESVSEEFANTTKKMSPWAIHTLNGSYRCPLRICECLMPLSEHIRKNVEGMSELMSPYKGSPPGARPIVVWGRDTKELASKVKDVLDAYADFDVLRNGQEVTILERDNGLAQALNQLKVPSRTETILKLKGMEMECILWSTQARIEDEEEKWQFVYTILTRTSSLLIIGVTPDRCGAYDEILKTLRKGRLIFWDHDTESTLEHVWSTQE